MNKLQQLALRTKVKADLFILSLNDKMNNALKDERGDTNWISVIVLVAIALVLAGAFIAFKDQIMDTVSNWLPDGYFNPDDAKTDL